ncbi:MAG: hypothetical protein JW717_10855 [Marinilabiliaceae bacterium]|nr:hypothetical protein [Marinilabiliaceae bacterium]
MASMVFEVEINGGWYETGKVLPDASGLIFVYAVSKKSNSTLTDFKKLLFIKETGNIKASVIDDDLKKYLQKFLTSTQKLCFHISTFQSKFLSRIAAAYINFHKPVANNEFKYEFPFHPTIIESVGEAPFIKPLFSVVNSKKSDVKELAVT